MARQNASSSQAHNRTRSSGQNSSQGEGNKQRLKAASPREKHAQKNRDAQEAAELEEERRLLDERIKRDIAGVVIALLGVVLLIAAIMPSDALVTSFISQFLHLALGIGAYLLPLFLIAIAVSFFVRFKQEQIPLRVAVGLILIFVAVLALLSLYEPNVASDPSLLFLEQSLSERGGYLGAGIAWVGLNLFGQIISTIILIGVIVAGLIIIGFSISGLMDRLRSYRERRLEDDFAEEEDEGVLGAPPYMPWQGRRSKTADEAEEVPPASVHRIPSAYRKIERPRPRRASSSLSTQLINQQADQADQDMSMLQDYDYEAGAYIAAHDDDVPDKLVTRRLGSKYRDATQLFEAEEPPVPSRGKSAASAGAAAAGAAATSKKASKKASKTDSQSTSQTAGSKQSATGAPHPQDGFELPSMDLLSCSRDKSRADEDELAQTGAHLQETLGDFGIYADVVGWVAGPTVTLFKVDLPAGVRVSRVTALEDDIALALAAPGVRIFAPIPGTNYVGIEVPNKQRQTVYLADVLKNAGEGPLQIAIGKDVEGHSIASDLARMPHLLIGGTTGSGKSVAINSMIMSILMRATPAEVRFILIDPKRVEFTLYNGIPHLYVPVVTEAKEAASALSWGVAEMERRLKIFSKVGARNIGQYNAKVQEAHKEAEEAAAAQAAELAKRAEQEAQDAQAASEAADAGEVQAEADTILLEQEEVVTDAAVLCENPLAEAEELPYIVIVIDELADLMMNVGKEVEFSISRIAQLARAAGIHLIVATQRPSTNVVTGLIKANITNRIAFNVASGIDSRVILDTPGAENLIGLGDLLFSKPEYSKPQRIQGCFVSEDEINAVVEFLKQQGEPEYHSEILSTNLITLGASAPDGSGGSVSSDDPLLWEAAEIVVSSGLGSTSSIQRRLKVGYSRAGRIMDMLEEKGVVGAPNGSKPREVLVDAMELETLKAFETHDAVGESRLTGE